MAERVPSRLLTFVIAEDMQVTLLDILLDSLLPVNRSNEDPWIIADDLKSLGMAGVIRWSYLDVGLMLIRGVVFRETTVLAKNRFRVYTPRQCNEIIIYFHSVAITEIDSIFFLHFVSSRPSTTAIISRNRRSLWNVYNISSGSNKWNIKG